MTPAPKAAPMTPPTAFDDPEAYYTPPPAPRPARPMPPLSALDQLYGYYSAD